MNLKNIKKYVHGTLKGMGAGLVTYLLLYLVRILGLVSTTSINGYNIETVGMWVIFLAITLSEIVD